METVNIHEAKTHLSRLLEKVERGESFVIARAGKPIAKLTAIDEKPLEKRKLGFGANENWVIPEDFDRWAEGEIAEMFGVKD